jgi:hypothetical protein
MTEKNKIIMWCALIISIPFVCIACYEGYRVGMINEYKQLQDVIEAKYDLVMYEGSTVGFTESNYHNGCFHRTDANPDPSTQVGHGQTQYGYMHGTYKEVWNNSVIEKSLCSSYYSSVTNWHQEIADKLRSLA